MTTAVPSSNRQQRGTSAASALEQRCGVIASAVGLSYAGGPQKFAAAVVAATRAASLTDGQAIFLLFQAFLARLPRQTEILDFVKHLDDPAETIEQRFCRRPEFTLGPQSQTCFRTIPAETLAVDVSQTLRFSHNSGIQRVVRSLAKQFHAQGFDHTLLQFDARHGGYRLLNTEETQLVLHWQASPRRRAKQTSDLVAWLRRTAGERLSNSVRCFLRTWNEHGKAARRARVAAKIAARQQGGQEVVFLWDNRFLLPELATETERLEGLRSLLSHAPLNSSLVLFDLIPVHSPEFFGSDVVDGFMRYLALVRNVNRVSCISRAVEQDLASLLSRGTPGRQSPKLATHYLGADFDFGAASPPRENHDTLPLVLSVGTIEVRKNHWRILRGMVQAQRRGCRFRGVFAGNPGWLNENFMSELAHHQSQGALVEMRQSVSESELSQLYGQADFTLYCSLAEGFGLPIVESVAKGVPCVTSNRGCMQEIAEQVGGCLLVDPESETQIADAIVSLLHDRDKYAALQAESRGASWLTWEEYAQNLYAFATAAEAAATQRGVSSQSCEYTSMPHKALITGISGQDGSYLAEHLLSRGYDVLAYRRPGGVSLGCASHLANQIRVRSFPLDSAADWERWLADELPDEIYHLGGISFVPDSWNDPLACNAANFDWTTLLLESVRRASPQSKLFYACSSEVFGAASTWPQDEGTPFRPQTPYAVSKAAAFWMVRTYRERYGLFVCSGILFNHESPRRDARFVTRKITRGVAAIAAGFERKMRLGNLAIQRDWGYAAEYVDAMHRMLQLPTAEDFVIGSGHLTTLQSVVELAFSAVKLAWRDHVEIDSSLFRPCELHRIVANASKAREKLGWYAHTPISELIGLMLQADLDLIRHPDRRAA